MGECRGSRVDQSSCVVRFGVVRGRIKRGVCIKLYSKVISRASGGLESSPNEHEMPVPAMRSNYRLILN